MKKIIRLTKRNLSRIVKKVIKETMENEMTSSLQNLYNIDYNLYFIRK